MSISIFNGFVVTNDEKYRVVKNGVVNIEQDRITAVGSASDVKAIGETRIDAKGGIIMPGLISTHDHAYGVMTHGMEFPQGWFPMPSFAEAILDWWWPAVEEVLTKDDLKLAVLASAIESVKTGTTTIIDILEAPNTIPGALDLEYEVLDPLGIRATLSFEASERISKRAGEEGLQENFRFIKKHNHQNARIKGMHCIHTTFSCSVELIQRVRELANQERAGIQIHLEEGAYESMWSHIHYRKTPVELYEKLGFLGQDVLASQAVHPTMKEREILAKNKVHISHQPVSNCEGGHGFAPVADMLNRGLFIGLGTDGVVLDLFEVMRMAHFIHKSAQMDATVMPAQTVFEMATLHGAQCTLQPELLGSLQPGKKADVVVAQPRLPTPLTQGNVIDQMILYCSGRDVRYTIIDGKVVVKEGVVQTVNEQKIRDAMAKAVPDYWERSTRVMQDILAKRSP